MTAEPHVSTRERLRAEAAALFAERGFSGTSMAELAERVGVRKATLYNYFPSKEDLLLELLQESMEHWREACRPPLEGPGTLEERLRGHLEAAIRFAAECSHQVAMVRLASSQLFGELAVEVHKRLGQQRREYLKLLERSFAAGLERGEVAGATATHLAFTWVAFFDGVMINVILGSGAREAYFAEREAYLAEVDALWGIVWRGLSGGATPRGDR